MYQKSLTILVCLIMMGLLEAKIINVPADHTTIQAGINAATDGDTVLVAENTYVENINFRGKAITVASHFLVDGDTTHINNTIIDGSQPSQPDSGSVVFFISGEDTNSVICGFTITGGTGTESIDNSRVGGGIFCYASGARIAHNKVITNSVTSYSARGGGIGTFPFGNNNYSIIEHNTIASNSCFGDRRGQGGGVYMPQGRIAHNIIRENYCEGETALGGGTHGACAETAERLLYIHNNTIENNECFNTKSSGRSGGGGVDTWGGVVLYLFDNIIMYNRVHPTHQADGGGVDLVYAVAPSIIQGNTISFNSYSGTDCAGGGLMLNRCEGVRVKNNRIEGNRAVWGGGIYLNRSHDIVIDNNHFERNIARNNGGGLNKYMDQDNNVAHINLLLEGEISGSVISRQEFTFSDSIRNNKFINNQATQYNGGGIYISTSEKSTISGNMFQGNQAAQGWGGGLLVRNAKATITNNVFTENLSNGGGGIGLAISGDDTVGIFDVINNTVVENRGNEGAGIANMRGTSTLINNIVWGNIGPKQIANQAEGTIYVSFSDIQGGEASVENTENSITEWLDGNIDADPLFADSVNFYLSENSPCIDAGHIHFLDPEDPDHPNFALWPAMRTRRSDMGAYGGADSLATRLSDKGVVSRRPAQFILYPNYPNPFNPSTTIIYDLPHTALVQLAVYDVLGREVKRLVDEQKSPGLHKITWDATNESGQRVAAGLYFCRMRSGDFATVIKLLFVR